jgi:hypothetical protein
MHEEINVLYVKCSLLISILIKIKTYAFMSMHARHEKKKKIQSANINSRLSLINDFVNSRSFNRLLEFRVHKILL